MCPTEIKTPAPTRIVWKIGEINMGTVIALLALAGGIVAGYGSLTTRMSAAEDFRAYQLAANERQTASQEAMAAEWRNLAIELRETRTILNERTERAEIRQQVDAQTNRSAAASNRMAIEKNREAIAKQQPAKKAKSLATILGIK